MVQGVQPPTPPPRTLYAPHSTTLCSPILPQHSFSPLRPHTYRSPNPSRTPTPRRTSLPTSTYMHLYLAQHPCVSPPRPAFPPKTHARVPLHPAISQPPPLRLGGAGGRPGGGRPLSVLPYLAEEGKPATGTAPARGSGHRREGRLFGRPVAPLADVGQRRHALLVPPVLCGEGQDRHDPPPPHCTGIGVSLLSLGSQPLQSPGTAGSCPSPLLAVMYTHFLSLLMGRGLPGAQETKLRRDPSDHLGKAPAGA